MKHSTWRTTFFLSPLQGYQLGAIGHHVEVEMPPVERGSLANTSIVAGEGVDHHASMVMAEDARA